MRIYAHIFALGLITACATTYKVPVEQAPPEWRVSETPLMPAIVKGTTKAFDGRMSNGDSILQFDVEHLRVATIQNELAWKGPFGNEEFIPAGSAAYASQFSLTRRMTYNGIPSGRTTHLNVHNNPIEWCIPRSTDAVCIFWEGPDRVKFITARGGIPMQAKPTTAAGMQGPMPIISEGEASFDQDLKAKVVISGLSSKGVGISPRFYSGDKWTQIGLKGISLRWANGDKQEFNIFGSKYSIERITGEDDKTIAVNVEVIDSAEDAVFATPIDRNELIKVIQAAIAARGALTEDEVDDEEVYETEQPQQSN